MQLTIDQQRAIKQGELVRVTDPEIGVECVVIRADVFRTLAYDDSSPTDTEKQPMLFAAGLRAGWDDPEMDVYDDLDPRKAVRSDGGAN